MTLDLWVPSLSPVFGVEILKVLTVLSSRCFFSSDYTSTSLGFNSLSLGLPASDRGHQALPGLGGAGQYSLFVSLASRVNYCCNGAVSNALHTLSFSVPLSSFEHSLLSPIPHSEALIPPTWCPQIHISHFTDPWGG